MKEEKNVPVSAKRGATARGPWKSPEAITTELKRDLSAYLETNAAHARRISPFAGTNPIDNKKYSLQ